jgi:hypothetical protein
MNKHYLNFINSVDRVIIQYGQFEPDEGYNLEFDSLELEVQSELSRLLLEYEDREVSECFLDPLQEMMNDDVTCALLALLKDNSLEKKDNLATLLLKRTVYYCSRRIQDVIEERCSVLMSEEGYVQYREPHASSFSWRASQ